MMKVSFLSPFALTVFDFRLVAHTRTVVFEDEQLPLSMIGLILCLKSVISQSFVNC